MVTSANVNVILESENKQVYCFFYRNSNNKSAMMHKF